MKYFLQLFAVIVYAIHTCRFFAKCFESVVDMMYTFPMCVCVPDTYLN